MRIKIGKWTWSSWGVKRLQNKKNPYNAINIKAWPGIEPNILDGEKWDELKNTTHSWFVLVSAHENLHETDRRFEVRLTNDWFVFVFVVELAWSEKTTQLLTLSLLTLSSFAAEIIFSCYKVWLDLNSSFHRTKVSLKGYPIPIPQHLIKIVASPLRKKKKTRLAYVYVYVRICIGRKCGLRRRWKLRVGTRQSTRNPKNVSTGETYQRLSIAGLHVTSQQSCWRCV